MGATTTKLLLPYPLSTDGPDGADVPYWINLLAARLDAVAASYDAGTIGSRPTAGKSGRFYRSTDETPNQLYLDTGAAWINVSDMGDDSVMNSMLQDNAVDARVLADDAVDAAAIQAGAVGTTELADLAITTGKVAAALKPSGGAAGATEALRALGTAAGTAAAGNDSRLSDARTPLDQGRCRVKRSSAKSLTNATETVIDFDQEDFDTATMHDTSTNNTRITFPATGVYDVGAFVTLPSIGNSSWMYLRLNGTTVIAGNTISQVNSGASCSALVAFSAGDYIELVVRQNAGSSQNATAVMWARRVP